jgi:hypothetical protein
MNITEFNELISKNGGRCLWDFAPKGFRFTLELWMINNGKTFIKQIWKDKGGESHYIHVDGMHWEDTAKALGITEPLLKSGDLVSVEGFGKGKCVGWVGNPPDAIRIQFDNGQVIDFHPNKLRPILTKLSE